MKKLLLANFNDADLPDDLWRRLRTTSDEVVVLSRDDSSFMPQVAEADGLVLRLGMSADAEFQDAAPNLKYIGMFGTGYGRIDVEHARQRGITVTNVADYSTQSVAELVVAAAIVEFRNLLAETTRAMSGDVDETEFVGHDVASRAVGVVGAGLIGRRVIELFAGLGSSVSYWSRTRRPEIESGRVGYTDIDSLLSGSGLVTVHLAANSDTGNFLDSKRVASLANGAVLINTAPNEVIDLEAVMARCSAGEIRFVMDHADELPASTFESLRGTPNVRVLPPIGYATEEASRRKCEVLVSNVEAFREGQPRNVVS